MNQQKLIAKMLAAVNDNDYASAKKHMQAVVEMKLQDKIAKADAKLSNQKAKPELKSK